MPSKKILLASALLVFPNQGNASETPEIRITPASSSEEMQEAPSQESIEMISPSSSDYLTPPEYDHHKNKRKKEIFLNWHEEMEDIERRVRKLSKTLLEGLEFAYLSCEKLEDKSDFAAARAREATACLEKSQDLQKPRTYKTSTRQKRITDNIKCLRQMENATQICKNVLKWIRKGKPFKLFYKEILYRPVDSESRQFDYFDESRELDSEKIISFLEIRAIRRKNVKEKIRKKIEVIEVIKNEIKALRKRLIGLKEDLNKLYGRDSRNDRDAFFHWYETE